MSVPSAGPALNKPKIQVNGIAEPNSAPPAPTGAAPPPSAPAPAPAQAPPAPSSAPPQPAQQPAQPQPSSSQPANAPNNDPEAAPVTNNSQQNLPMYWQSRLSRFFIGQFRRVVAAVLNLPASSRRFFWFLVFYVYDTSSTAYYVWIGITAVAATYDLTLIVARAVFTELQSQYLQLWYGLDYAADAIYLLDMFVKSRTGFLEQGLLVRDLKLLAKTYVKTVGFAIDVISILPTDLIFAGLGTSYVIVRINRLFRIGRISEFLTKTEARVPSPNAFRIAILLTYILMIIHWNGCIYYAISKYIGIGDGNDTWVFPKENENETLLDKYVYCYWWATVVLTNIAEINHPQTEFETFIQVANFLIGLLIFASLVGKVGTMITSMNAAQNEFQFRLDSVKQYMKFRKVTPDLQSKVLKWFDYIWMHRQMSNEDKVLRLLPEKLRAEIAIHVHLETLKRVKLFQDSELGLLVELVLKLRLQVFSPGDYICRKGDIGKEMYICKSGKLEVVSDDGEKVFATLTDGSVFGEISLISIPGNKTGNRRTANVRSKGYSDLFVLSKEDLHAALREYPDAMQKLVEKGTEMLRKEGKIDDELAARHVAAEMKVEHKFGTLESHLDKLQSRVAQLLNDFNGSDRTLKQRLTRMEYALSNVPAAGAAAPQNEQQQQAGSNVDGGRQSAASKLVRAASIGGVGSDQQQAQAQAHHQHQSTEEPSASEPASVSIISVPVPQVVQAAAQPHQPQLHHQHQQHHQHQHQAVVAKVQFHQGEPTVIGGGGGGGATTTTGTSSSPRQQPKPSPSSSSSGAPPKTPPSSSSKQ